MTNRIFSTVLCASIAMLSTQSARAEVEVTISKMHLCCGACVKAVEGAVEKVDSVTVNVDRDAGSAVVTAPDKKNGASGPRSDRKSRFSW